MCDPHLSPYAHQLLLASQNAEIAALRLRVEALTEDGERLARCIRSGSKRTPEALAAHRALMEGT